ncbi:MAG TPA: hypothetical protein VL463_14445 [Kofleriaceae bacterium]|jgi:hypothetical protein|nr:hypothetical protein [Kofleriaceae bacterium]
MRRAYYALIAASCGAAAHPRATCPSGDVAIRVQRDADALAGCRAVGSISIKTAAAIDLRPLGSIEQIDHDLVIGPTIAVSAIDGFGALRAVGGAIRVSANAEVTGAYFPALERAGSLAVDGNLSLADFVAPKLARVDGDVAIAHNGALQLLDLGALVVAGKIQLDDNRQLGDIHVPALHP